MGKAKEKISKIASGQNSDWLSEARERKTNIDWTKRSFIIAVRILHEIREQNAVNGMTQKKLAGMMCVTPQYINKVVKGKENLTLVTISRIEKALGIALIEVASVDTSHNIIMERA